MNALLAALPFIPLVSFLILIVAKDRLSWRIASLTSVGALFLCAIVSLLIAQQALSVNGESIRVTLWQWMQLENSESWLPITFSLVVDRLAAVMISVVSGVGFLIHLYAACYMKEDENFVRFMAYLNLFIVAMLLLVLADNLVLLYLGWEGVGLCSFLLIGFWYQEKKNADAARKAFIITRIGDTSMMLGLLLLFTSIGELQFERIDSAVIQQWSIGNDTAFWVALLLLGGAVGKSAQLPLHTWLPDAMAGPTPVSALIHAATMVTAGVYLIARTQSIFMLAPEVMNLVAWCGAITLLLAGITALAQTDLKRILAYSTMSQIGYMMLALGAGAWSAGVFHLMTHAFFKALLFLCAGSIIYALHHQQDVFKMGGLLKKLPLESGLFTVGLICLIALPGTSGFFSKEFILGHIWQSSTAGPLFWWLAIIGALLTSLYSCRLFILVFLGECRFEGELHRLTSRGASLALLVLAALSLVGGIWHEQFNVPLVPVPDQTLLTVDKAFVVPHWLHTVAIATPFAGIAIAWVLFAKYRRDFRQPLLSATNLWVRFARAGLGFDYLYFHLIQKPFVFIARANRRDVLDQLLMLLSHFSLWTKDAILPTQNGSIRWYAAAFALGLSVYILGWLL
ncbi:NADH-quinone oxidoreductase subunit L [Thalassotalea fusca]